MGVLSIIIPNSLSMTFNKTLVIQNPISGRGHAAMQWRQVDAELRRYGFEFDLAQTERGLHAVELASEVREHGYDRVIAAGGDGLLHEILNGLMLAYDEAPTVPIGIIPLGSGNDFNKMLPPACAIGETRNDWRAAIARIVNGEPKSFDVGRIRGDNSAPGQPHPHYFTNGMDIGFGAFVAKHAKDVPRFLHGTTMYLASIILTLANYQVPRLKIYLDDGTKIEQRSTMTAVANGRCFGGGFWIAPAALADDARFEVMVSTGLGRLGILALVPKVMKGTHVNHPAVWMTKAARVVIESADPLVIEADGEVPFFNAHHLEIDILPGRLCVIV